MHEKRYLARIILEADTPLKIGTGQADIMTDAPVFCDANHLPQIPGTSLAGILRHSLSLLLDNNEVIESIFGYQKNTEVMENETDIPEKGTGSRLLISNAYFMIDHQTVVEGLTEDKAMKSEFIQNLFNLPVREHCRINEKGTSDAAGHGKFDEVVVPRGIRFQFEMEFLSSAREKEDEVNWYKILGILINPAFRIGGRTRSGFGKMKIISLKTRAYNLVEPADFDAYLKRSASLNSIPEGLKEETQVELTDKQWILYRLELEPEDFFLFSSGFGDNEVDITPKYEKIVKWIDNKPQFSRQQFLIPASSIKGALSHRVAFYYNCLNGIYADKIEDYKHTKEQYTGENNRAVYSLFGKANASEDKNLEKGIIGKVLISDLFLEENKEPKIFNHVAIDRFTGGARRGALFNEKVAKQQTKLELEILVDSKVLDNKLIKQSFEKALADITEGNLPLGGGVMRGHGVFRGRMIINN